MSTNGLFSPAQSAYRSLHSTETSLLKVSNDILCALEEGKCTLLVTLDITAAFDTVNHQRLLQCFEHNFGFSETVLSWFTSYLSNRTQRVKIGHSFSESIAVESGFPQGSVLGGMKYNMYTTPLDKLIVAHSVSHEDYADDSNLYTSFDLRNCSDTTDSVARLEHCLDDVETWLLQNRLKLNHKKTEAVLFCPARQTNVDYCPTSVRVGKKQISVSNHFKSLGVVFDKPLKMVRHVNASSSSVFYHIRRISKARRYFNRGVTETLVNAIVTSRLDYCNSLLCSLPMKSIRKLQCAQNAAAKTIFLARKRAHVTPLLKELHWLPVKFRCMYKVLILTYKTLSGEAPEYLIDLLSEYQPSRNLRSSSEHFLVRPRVQRNNYGNCAFCNLSPTLWNSLPTNIRKAESLTVFKGALKTHFFMEHFDSHI